MTDTISNASSVTLALFGQMEQSGTMNGGAYATGGRMYAMQIFDNDILIRDFIPVQNAFTGEIGLWDEVTGSFFGNCGTGVFLMG